MRITLNKQEKQRLAHHIRRYISNPPDDSWTNLSDRRSANLWHTEKTSELQVTIYRVIENQDQTRHWRALNQKEIHALAQGETKP